MKKLTAAERETIATMKEAGLKASHIAKSLGRPPSTIGRELKRNCGPGGRYCPRLAQQLADDRRSRSSSRSVFSTECR